MHRVLSCSALARSHLEPCVKVLYHFSKREIYSKESVWDTENSKEKCREAAGTFCGDEEKKQNKICLVEEVLCG